MRHDVPDVTAAMDAVAALHAQIQDAYTGVRPADRADAREWALLAAKAVELERLTHYIRDATLVVARNAGASWPRLARETGVPDATLHNRYKRFREVEQ